MSSSLLLRFVLAFALIYPAASAILNPDAWIGYFPAFVFELGTPELVLLHGFGAIEIALAVWLISGWRVFYPALATAALLLLIAAFNFTQMDVLFRDIALAGAALALALIETP